MEKTNGGAKEDKIMLNTEIFPNSEGNIDRTLALSYVGDEKKKLGKEKHLAENPGEVALRIPEDNLNYSTWTTL
jgi:hypothetical protein